MFICHKSLLFESYEIPVILGLKTLEWYGTDGMFHSNLKIGYNLFLIQTLINLVTEFWPTVTLVPISHVPYFGVVISAIELLLFPPW